MEEDAGSREEAGRVGMKLVVRLLGAIVWQVPFLFVTDFGFYDWQWWAVTAGVVASWELRDYAKGLA